MAVSKMLESASRRFSAHASLQGKLGKLLEKLLLALFRIHIMVARSLKRGGKPRKTSGDVSDPGMLGFWT